MGLIQVYIERHVESHTVRGSLEVLLGCQIMQWVISRQEFLYRESIETRISGRGVNAMNALWTRLVLPLSFEKRLGRPDILQEFDLAQVLALRLEDDAQTCCRCFF